MVRRRQHHHEQEQDGGTGTERRRQEAGGHDGGEPVMAAGDARVQEGRDRVNGESPQDGQVNKGLDPFGRVNFVPFGLKGDPADDHVEAKIADEHHHDVEHDKLGEWGARR